MAVPPPHRSHVDSRAIDETRELGRRIAPASPSDVTPPFCRGAPSPNPYASMLTDKRALRARLRAERDAFAADGPEPIKAPPAFVDRLRPGAVVASYAPLASEADPAALAAAAVAVGCTLALPHVVDRATPLRFLAWDGVSALVRGPFGLNVPPAAWPGVAPDVILTPLLAFDRALNRLGQGAGHYDRAFAAHPQAWRVGVAWSVQQVEALVPDAWDVPLHNLVTEQEWLTR